MVTEMMSPTSIGSTSFNTAMFENSLLKKYQAMLEINAVIISAKIIFLDTLNFG